MVAQARDRLPSEPDRADPHACRIGNHCVYSPAAYVVTHVNAALVDLTRMLMKETFVLYAPELIKS